MPQSVDHSEPTVKPMKVAVIGAGPMGCATAAYMAARGHHVAIWAPRTTRLERHAGKGRVICVGGLSGAFEFDVLAAPAAVADFDVAVVCLPGHAYADVLGPLNAHWRTGQTVLVSGALSLCALWLREAAAARSQSVQVAAWGTTATTAHFLADGTLHVNPLRERIDMAALSTRHSAAAHTLCQLLLGERFVAGNNLLLPTLANINPIAHAAEVIPNLTRMDLGEAWPLFGCFTGVVGRLAQSLDQERLAVARAFAFEIPSLQEHYSRSYHVPIAPLHSMAAQIQSRGMGPNGPNRLQHRYILEDGPFGMVFLEALAQLVDVQTPVLTSCITLLQSAYGRDFRGENFLMAALSLGATDASSLRKRCADAHNAANAPL